MRKINIKSFKLRKELSSKDKHYVLYGLAMRDETLILENIVSKLDNESFEFISDIFKRYGIKHIKGNNKLKITMFKDRFFKKYSNKNKAPKYLTNRVHILGLMILFYGNINVEDKTVKIDLDHMTYESIRRIIVRLQNYNILSKLEDKSIVLYEGTIDNWLFYEEYYDITLLRNFKEKL